MKSVKILLVGTLLIFCINCFCNAQNFSLNAKILDIGFSDGFDSEGSTEYLSIEMLLQNINDTTRSFWIMRASWQESFISDVEGIEFLLKEYSANFQRDYSTIQSINDF